MRKDRRELLGTRPSFDARLRTPSSAITEHWPIIALRLYGVIVGTRRIFAHWLSRPPDPNPHEYAKAQERVTATIAVNNRLVFACAWLQPAQKQSALLRQLFAIGL